MESYFTLNSLITFKMMSYIQLFSRKIPENLRTVKSFHNKNSVVVCAAVSITENLSLKYIDKRIKMLSDYNKQNILAKHLLANVDRLYPRNFWILQQSSASSQLAKTTQASLYVNCPNFIM